MFDLRLIFHKPTIVAVDFTLFFLHWVISWLYVWLLISGPLTNYVLLIGTILMAALSGAAIMLLMVERRQRNSIIKSRVNVLTEELELSVVDMTNRTRVEKQRFDVLHGQYVEALVDIERLRDDFKNQLEDAKPDDAVSLRRKKTMLVVLGPDDHLHWDLAELEGLGMRIEVMNNPTTVNFKARLNSYRSSKSMPHYVHMAMHGNALGVKFANELAAPIWIRRQLEDVRHCALGSCQSDQVAFQMRLISSRTLCFGGEVDSIGASRFMLSFYGSLLAGHSKDEAFWSAKEVSPPEVGDMAMLV